MIDKHMKICEKLNALYKLKNKAYGDSFHNTFKLYGLIMVNIRLCDKINRLQNLIDDKNINYMDESINDTLMDIANYAIMTLMELEQQND